MHIFVSWNIIVTDGVIGKIEEIFFSVQNWNDNE